MIEEKEGQGIQDGNDFPLNNKHPYLVYQPQLTINQNWYHPILGYPMCPLIGRYNKGDYIIGDVIVHMEFKCRFDQNQKIYKCGKRALMIPESLQYQLRTIPQIITYNRPKNLKNEPEVHHIHHTIQKQISLNCIISFGEIGKDFINYLNHTYLFDESVFYGDKLNRTTNNIPIIAYLPHGSGICSEEVERGISMREWRSEYLSIHLKGGAPAFSPNNMRLGIEGGKKVVTNPNNKNKNNKESKKEGKKKYRLKNSENKEANEIKKEEDVLVKKQTEQNQIDDLFGEDLFQDDNKEKRKFEEIGKKDLEKKQNFIHFYTAVLLEKDHRINYHWHIGDLDQQAVIKDLLHNSKYLSQFVSHYKSFLGEDSLILQLQTLLGGFPVKI